MVSGTTLGWDRKVNCISSVYNLLVHWFWNEYGGGWAEGTVTLGQGDRSRQVCVCECTSVCQHIVPGQQGASQRISVTFSLSIPSVSIRFSVPPSSYSDQSSVSSLSQHNKPCLFWSKHTNKHRCGCFIHELHWDSVLTLVRNNINVSCVL